MNHDANMDGCLGYWYNMHFSSAPGALRDLAIMGFEISTIPLSSDPERVFSGSRYTISDQRSHLADDIFEALECIKSWDREGHLDGSCHQVEEVEKVLLDLQQRAGEMQL